MTKPTTPSAPTAHVQTSLRTKLMFAASAGIIAVAIPGGGIYGSRAFAQSINGLPTGCSDDASLSSTNNGNGTADPGETIECVSDQPGDVLDPLSTDVADLTVNLGNENGDPDRTIIEDTSPGSGWSVALYGPDQQTLNNKSNSTIQAGGDKYSAAYIVSTTGGTVSLTNAGLIKWGDFDASTPDSTGRAIYTRVNSGAGDTYINSTGQIEGEVYVRSSSSGKIDLTIADLKSSSSEGGLRVAARQNVARIDVDVGNILATEGNAIFISNEVRDNTTYDLINPGSAVTNLTITDTVSGYAYGALIVGGINTTVTLGANAKLEGKTEYGLYIDQRADTGYILVQGTIVGETPQGSITGDAYGAAVGLQNGNIVIKDLATVSGGTGDALSAVANNGNVTINNVTSVTSKDAYGIYASTRRGSGNIAITNIGTASSDGDSNAIQAKAANGNILIDQVNSATSKNWDGIYANTLDGSGSIRITNIKTISGGMYGSGIAADTRDGTILIDTVEAVKSSGRHGIAADSRTGEGNIFMLNIGTVMHSGSRNALTAETSDGNILIDTVGKVASYGNAIFATTEEGTGNVTIRDVGSASSINFCGRRNGIRTRSLSGDILIEQITSATSAGRNGIYAQARDAAGNITIRDVTAVSGEERGIYVRSTGGSVTLDAIESASSSGGEGIYIENTGATGTISASAGHVSSGAVEAIKITTQSAETTELTVSGKVTPGADQTAILLSTAAGASVTIAETGTVTRGGVDFLGTGALDNADTFTLFGTVTGDVLMGAGSDTFNLGSLAFDAVFGGDGLDTLNITGSSELTINDAALAGAQSFELLSFEATRTLIDGPLTGFQSIDFNAGTTILDEGLSLDIGPGQIAEGATFNMRDGASFTGDLVSNGTFEIGSSPGTATINGTFTQGPTGLLPIELEGNAFDRLIVNGAARLDGTLSVFAADGDLLDGGDTAEFLTASGGITGRFAQVIDNIPDLNFDLIFSDTSAELRFKTDPALISAKQIAPSALIEAMQSDDLFTETLMLRRASSLEPNRWAFWSGGFGGTQKVGMRKGQDGWQSDQSGYAIGVEHLSSQDGTPILFGFSAGYTESALDSYQSFGDVETYHIGGFAQTQREALALAGAVSFAWQDYGFDRYLIGEDFFDIARGTTEGTSWTLRSEAFYDLNWGTGTDGPYAFGPLATLEAYTAEQNSFTETGAGRLNLTYLGQDATQAVLGLGGQGRFSGDISGWDLDAGLSLLWESVGGDLDVQMLTSLANIDGTLAASSTKLVPNRVALGFDGKLKLSDGVFAHIRYNTTNSHKLIDHAGWAGITIAF